MDKRGRRILKAVVARWQERLLRPVDEQVRQVVTELLPAEDGIPIPGIWGFIGCYVRLRTHRRPAITKLVERNRQA